MREPKKTNWPALILGVVFIAIGLGTMYGCTQMENTGGTPLSIHQVGLAIVSTGGFIMGITFAADGANLK